jgi:hypothetical protein
MGSVRSVPRAVIFGTAQYRGLGLTHLAAMQGRTRFKYLLGRTRCGDAMGRFLQMLLEYTQLECGCRVNPLAHDYNNYSALLINKNWITEVWEHLNTYKATVEVNGLWQPEANIEHDAVIMETIVASGRFRNKELKDINYCRIYLPEFFISDIANLEGNKIE